MIIVGSVIKKSEPAGAIHKSRFDAFQRQTWKAKIRVENVIKGDIPDRDIDIYFSMYLGNLTGGTTHLNLVEGERDLFFLMPDSGELRTICDGWRTCVEEVRSGAHPNFSVRGKQVNEAIIEVLLSRGIGTTDSQMIAAIKWASRTRRFGEPSLVKQLQQLAHDESAPVKKAACAVLKNDLSSRCEEAEPTRN